jgi:dihydroorotase
MKPVLIRSVNIIHPSSNYNNTSVDILIIDGKIAQMGNGVETSEDVVLIDGTDKYLCPGFFDLNVSFGVQLRQLPEVLPG